ncbi:hypothetical protein GF323_03125 [Candidatus Woesearchaeota archaeon]|nr:hypothetical protein [Candidatus Woesearchaeota archaeon]
MRRLECLKAMQQGLIEMGLKIFTMPTCDKCNDMKEYLMDNNVDFEDINIGDDEGVKELRKIYPKFKDRIERSEDGQLPIPLLVMTEQEEIRDTAHTLEQAKAILNK